MSYQNDRVQLAQNLRKMQRDCTLAARNIAILRRTAYKSAVLVNRMLKESMGDLIAELRTAYPGSKSPVDAWLVDQFRPYVALGGDYCEALRAVENGVTLTRFLALDFTITHRAKRPATKPVTKPLADTIPDAPSLSAPVAERAVVWEKRAVFLDTRLDDVHEQLKAARIRIRELEEENAILKARLRKFENV